MSRRAFAGAIFGTVVVTTSRRSPPTPIPSRPIRVISPFPPGSASDTVSRVVLDQVSQILGQPMVIETKPGAGGIVGFADVAKADPDGYTHRHQLDLDGHRHGAAQQACPTIRRRISSRWR